MKTLFCLLLTILATVKTQCQTMQVSGRVVNTEGENLPGVSVLITEIQQGTVTNRNGEFKVASSKPFPLNLSFSLVSYAPVSMLVQSAAPLTITLQKQETMGQEVVVGATRNAISSLESPVSIERLGTASLQTTAAATYYDAIANLKGADFTSSGLLFKTPSTRGFNGSGSTRVNQLVDGMDNQAPGLNFFVGSFTGLTELDVDNIELLPGASSALYGSGGMNGTILINSKNPFTYQGLSIQVKEGMMNVDRKQRPGVTAYNDLSLRWAKAFSSKFAVKIGVQYVKAKDWLANDSANYLRIGDAGHVIPGTRRTDPNYDGVNVYGDETTIDIKPNIPDPYKPFFQQTRIDVSRTGYAEADIIDPVTSNLKLTGAIHYKLNSNTEASLAAYWGKGSTVYTGSDRYAFKDAVIAQYKAEIKNKNWFARVYTTQEDAGHSYASTILARQLNERWKSSPQWYNEYISTYAALYLTGTPDAEAHREARAVADQGRPLPGSPQFQQIFNDLKNTPISKGGGMFLDKTDLWVAEGQYNFGSIFHYAEIIAGGNYKKFILNSQGTIFIDTAGTIPVSEVGAYLQATKKLFNDRLTVAVSGRYDKNQNFKGKFTPRYSALIKLARNNNIRLSFQSAFHFPTAQQQYIYLPIGSNSFLLGGLPWINSIMGKQVFEADGTTPYVYKEFKPEVANTFEAGYKALIANKLLIDVYGYTSRYKDFIGRKLVVNLATGNVYAISVNSENKVRTYGYGAGLNYQFTKTVSAAANFYSDKITDVPVGFIASYNTPRYRVNAGISSTGIGTQKKWGFAVQYRWQDKISFENDFANGLVRAFSTIDAQLNYKLLKNVAELRLGGNNIINHYYQNGFGSPTIGALYYVALRLNLL